MLDYNLSLIFWQFWAWKTYYIVREAKKAFERGDIVISNTWLSFPHIRFYVPSDLPPILGEINAYHHQSTTPIIAPPSFLKAHNIEKKEGEVRNFFILIDEAWIFFNSREFASNFKDPALREMFTQPRKYGMQICVICQDLEMVDKTIRDLSQEVIEFTRYFFGLGRRAYSYDKKYIKQEWGWTPDIPVIDSKTYWHIFQRRLDESKFFGWLYYTREILGHKAIRHPEDIRTLQKYFQMERENMADIEVLDENPPLPS